MAHLLCIIRNSGGQHRAEGVADREMPYLPRCRCDAFAYLQKKTMKPLQFAYLHSIRMGMQSGGAENNRAQLISFLEGARITTEPVRP